MCSHIATIGIGILFIIGGLSGNLVLKGTNSGPLLALVGLIAVIYSFARIAAITRKARAADVAPSVTTKPAPTVSGPIPAAEAKPTEIPASLVTPSTGSVALPDARGLSTNEKAILLVKVLQNRKQEVIKDANSITVENMDRYLKKFPITETELLSIQQGLDVHKKKMIAAQVEPEKIAQAEQWCGLLQEFGKIRFHQFTFTPSR